MDDPLIKYSSTELPPERTKAQIDGILAEYQVKDVFWHYDPRGNSVYVMFKIEEYINDVPISVSARVDCPTIWNRARTTRKPHRPEEINWQVSMRAMYHFIYTSLNNAYAMQSSATVGFLGYIQTGRNEREVLKDILIPKLTKNTALEFKDDYNPKIIDVTNEGMNNE